MLNKLKRTAKEWKSKFIKLITVMGATLFITLSGNANPTSAEVQKEIKEVCKKNPDKEIVVKIESSQDTGKKIATLDTLGNDTIKDPYDQIREYVDAADTAYFNQLKTYMETKDSTEKIRCKAVVYAILQDTTLTQEQKEILALSQFEILTRMSGSDYRFSKKSSALTTTDAKYKERTQRYYAYKTYLSNLALDVEIAKLDKKNKQLDEKNKQLDEKNKQLDEEIKTLERQVKLFKWLLETYQNYKK